MNEYVRFDHEMLSEEKEEEKKLQPTHEKKGDAEDFLLLYFRSLRTRIMKNSTYNED